MEDGNLQRPLSPYEREQARLVREYNERREQEQKQVDALEARLIDEEGPRFRQRAKELGAPDEATQKLAAELIAKDAAEKKIAPHRVEDFHVQQAVDQAIAAQELRQPQEAERARADKEQADQARAAETLKQQQQEKQAEDEARRMAAQEAARQEPVPGTMQRFAAMMAERQAQRDAEGVAQKGRMNNADMDRSEDLANRRPNYARHNDLTQENAKPDERVLMKKEEHETPKGEITDTRAARFARMFEKPVTDRQFDPTHDPSNTRNFSRERGGHER